MNDLSGINKNYTNTIINNAKKQVEESDFAKKLSKAYKEKDYEQLKDVCNQFESIFMKIIYKEMRNTVPDSGLIQKDAGRDIFQSMYDEKIAEEASKNGGVGLAKLLYEQLKKSMDNKYVEGKE